MLTWPQICSGNPLNAVLAGTNGGASRRPGEELDMTLPLMYYSAAWVWLEYLTRGPACAEQAMSDSLNFAKQSFRHMGDGPANGASADHNANSRLGGTSAGELVERRQSRARLDAETCTVIPYP